MICTLPDEAACEKLRWFLRKSVLFFVALSAIFFHFFIKATLPSLFYLPIAYGQLAACLAGFAPADGIGQFKLGNAEVFEQVPDVRMVVNGQHDFSFIRQAARHTGVRHTTARQTAAHTHPPHPKNSPESTTGSVWTKHAPPNTAPLLQTACNAAGKAITTRCRPTRSTLQSGRWSNFTPLMTKATYRDTNWNIPDRPTNCYGRPFIGTANPTPKTRPHTTSTTRPQAKSALPK